MATAAACFSAEAYILTPKKNRRQRFVSPHRDMRGGSNCRPKAPSAASIEQSSGLMARPSGAHPALASRFPRV